MARRGRRDSSWHVVGPSVLGPHLPLTLRTCNPTPARVVPGACARVVAFTLTLLPREFDSPASASASAAGVAHPSLFSRPPPPPPPLPPSPLPQTIEAVAPPPKPGPLPGCSCRSAAVPGFISGCTTQALAAAAAAAAELVSTAWLPVQTSVTSVPQASASALGPAPPDLAPTASASSPAPPESGFDLGFDPTRHAPAEQGKG